MQDIDAAERAMQNKRQDKLEALESLLTFQDEMDALKLESVASSTSLERMKTTLKITEVEASEKRKQLVTFKSRFDEIKMNLEAEMKVTTSQEKATQNIEERLKLREKELKISVDKVQVLKHQMFKDSQVLADLRQRESNHISEIRSTQVIVTYYLLDSSYILY